MSNGGESRTTTDHDQIRERPEERGGRPARVEGTADDDGGGLLRLDFDDGDGDDSPEEISWDEFEESNLAPVYQDETSGGDESRVAKRVSRDEG